VTTSLSTPKNHAKLNIRFHGLYGDLLLKRNMTDAPVQGAAKKMTQHLKCDNSVIL